MKRTYISEAGFGMTAAIMGIAALAVIALGAVMLASPDATTPNPEPTVETSTLAETTEPMDDAMMSEGELSATAELEMESEAMEETDAMMMDDETDDTMTEEETEPAAATAEPGTFTDYDPSLLANAEDGQVLLFFHASWCPSCRALERSINENLSEIPSGVTILKVDFDSATELRQEYGVVRQHTLVEVDANGNQVKTLTGLTNTLDQVVNQI